MLPGPAGEPVEVAIGLIKQIPVGDLLPALVLAPVLVAIVGAVV